MNSPSSLIDESLNIGFKINLESHKVNQANPFLSITPIYPDFMIESSYINKTLNKMTSIYARLKNQYKFEYHIIFSANFFKINEEDQRIDEIEVFLNLNFNSNLTESDKNNHENKSQLEHQIQIQETKESGWIFVINTSMKKRFHKTDEIKGSCYGKFPLRSSALITVGNDDKCCFVGSILAKFHPCESIHPSRVSNYRQYLNELNIQGFNFRKRFNCSDVHQLEKVKILSSKIFELNFDQDENKWKHNIYAIEVSKNDSDRVVDLLIYKIHCVLIKK